MEIRNVKRWAKAGAEPYLVGLAGFVLALLLRYALRSVLDDHLPMLFFAVNCIVIAFLYGAWPSFLLLSISFPAAIYFFTKPYYSIDPLSQSDLFILIVYSTLVGLAAVMIESLRREQYKSSLLVRVSDSRYRLLIEADEDRRAAQRKCAVEKTSTT